MKTMKLFALLLLTSTANAATWYVSPTGNDGNIGTLAEPFLTIQKGHDVAVAGDTIYARGGTYESSTEVTITRDGVSGNPIRLLAYPNERPSSTASISRITEPRIFCEGNRSGCSVRVGGLSMGSR